MKKLSKFLFYAFILVVILTIVFYILSALSKNRNSKYYDLKNDSQKIIPDK